MKILLATHLFHPSIGGLETVARVLAEQFTAEGHDVIVVAQNPAGPTGKAETKASLYPVIRQPSRRELLRLVRWCDVYLQHNISLRTLWPLLFVRRPWVVSHHTWLTRVDGSVGWQDHFKMFLLRFGTSITISQAIAERVPVPSVLIGNPFDDRRFRLLPDVPRTRDIIFLSRLVSDKGGDLLLEAIARLLADGLTPSLTIVGQGPEEPALRAQAQRLGIAGQIDFAGVLTGETLVRLVNSHRIMAVPSRLPEPFGVVALEGIACGCALVGSERGGLRDAIGPCGLLFPNGDVDALARCLGQLLLHEDLRARLQEDAPEHLEQHSPARMAARYLEIFERVVRR